MNANDFIEKIEEMDLPSTFINDEYEFMFGDLLFNACINKGNIYLVVVSNVFKDYNTRVYMPEDVIKLLDKGFVPFMRRLILNLQIRRKP